MITEDCALAQAPSWEPCGRVRKYAAVSSRPVRRATPRTMTCRAIGCQGKSSETYGFSARSRALRES